MPESAADILVRLYGSAPPTSVAPAYGTQANPLDYFAGAAGTGNKTTNADLPEWLRAAGMKGDAYAGGMLKPALRYGFLFKNGKIHFADGTVFDAKKVKVKGGQPVYQYTGADGSLKTYDPTDEQDAYNTAYKKATANQSFVDKLGATADRTRQHVHDVLHGAGQALQGKGSIFGGTPLGTKLSNAVTGRHDKPIADQYGGPTDESQAKYVASHGGNSLGYQPELHAVGSAIGSAYAGNYGVGRLGQLFSAPAGVSTTAPAGNLGTSFGEGVAQGIGSAVGDAAGTGVGAGIGAGIGTSVAGGFAGGAGTGAGMGTAAGASYLDWLGPLINAGASIYAGNQAGNAVNQGEREANWESRRQFDLVRGDTAPIRALGNAAVGTLADLQGFNESGTPNMARFYTSPDYNFNLGEGQKAIDRSAIAKSGLLSGGAVKEGIRYAQGNASREYSAFVDRLMTQAGLGNTGIGASAAAGANSASNIGNAAINAGNSRASIYGNTAANVNNAVQSGIGNYVLRRYLEG